MLNLSLTIDYDENNISWGRKLQSFFFFNLKKSELVDLQYKTSKGFISYIEEITKAGDNSELWKAFRDIVLLAYGEKSDDGERFS